MAVPRSFPAVVLPSGCVAIFDPWIEDARSWGPHPSRATVGRIRRPEAADENTRDGLDPLIGETIEFNAVAHGEGIRDLPHVARAPLCQLGVFNHRPDITESLAAAGPALRAAVVEALIAGVQADGGAIHARIGDAEIIVDPTTAEWSIENDDGHRRAGLSLRHFAHALGAVPDGVFAVRLLETIFACRISAIVALAISDALDRMHPVLKESGE